MSGEIGRTVAAGRKGRLTFVLCLTATDLVAEVAGGLLFNSLALLADAGHMLTDVMGLALALAAIRFGERPATPARTYGYYRLEVLAALANGVLLIGISLYILYEAYERFRNPPEVAGAAVVAVAAVGLVINLVSMRLLHAGAKGSLNVRGAYLEVLSDMLASIGVIVAGSIVWLTGWNYADPLVSAAIGLFILPRTWRLLGEVVGILLEGTPKDVDLARLRREVEMLPGVAAAHDLHAWTVTSGMHAMSLHVVLSDGGAYDQVLKAVQGWITAGFGIAHVTVQVEPPGVAEHEVHL